MPEQLNWWRLLKLRLADDASEADAVAFTSFLNKLLESTEHRISAPVRLFAEVSAASFEESGHKPIMEGFVAKRRWGRNFMDRTFEGGTRRFLGSLSAPYKDRWLILRDDHLSYTANPQSPVELDIILFDESFVVEEIRPAKSFLKRLSFWFSGFRNALKISNGYRTLVVKLENRHILLKWLIAIKTAVANSGLNQRCRFNAASPPRRREN